MRSLPVKLRIPEPCHEDWNKMTPKDQGSFCSSCAKVVVDFTRMSDRELLSYLEKTKGQKTCGRFSSFQLNRSIAVSDPKPSYFNSIKKVILGFLFSLSLPSFLKAEHKSSSFFMKQDLSEEEETANAVSGRIVDVNQNPLEGIAIRIYYNGRITEHYSLSDAQGSFSIDLANTKWSNKLELRIEAPGYMPLSLSLGSEKELDLVLYERAMILGKMKVEEIDIVSIGDVAIEIEELSIEPELVSDRFPEIVKVALLNENEEPIVAAQARIKDSDIWATSNEEGQLEFILDEALRSRTHLVVVCNVYPYYRTEYVIDRENYRKEEAQIMVLELASPEDFLMGQWILDPLIQQEAPTSQELGKEPGWKEKGFKSRKEHLHYLKMNPEKP
ncbi:MAG: carboxypeptidase regulatory-like domain-containing protein [Chitinophagales bacterium]|nr:carboxypeptidase regulatory-like domain-containing protein [Chitinophagales bacterium]